MLPVARKNPLFGITEQQPAIILAHLKGDSMRSLAVLLGILSLGFAGSRDFWKNGDPAQWTPQEIQRLLTDSPWSQVANATFPQAEEEPAQPAIEVPQAGMPNPEMPPRMVAGTVGSVATTAAPYPPSM